MNFEDARTLLSRVAVLDNRTVDSITIQLWGEILQPFSLNEALWALREFGRNNTKEYLRPAHLVEIIRRKRGDFADMNPGREAKGPDSWLEFESELDRAVDVIKAIRAMNRQYAVDAIDAVDAIRAADSGGQDGLERATSHDVPNPESEAVRKPFLEGGGDE